MLRLTRQFFDSKTLFERITGGTHKIAGGAGLVSAMKQRWFYNRVAKSLLLPLCNGRFESVDSDLLEGGPEALKFVVESLAAADFNALTPTTEESLLSRLQTSGEDWRGEWSMGQVQMVRLEKLQVIMGALRGEDLKNKTVVPLFGQFFVLDNADASLAELPMRERLELLRKELHAGVVIQGEVLVKIDQVVKGEPQLAIDHLLKLEASIIPHPDVATEFRPAGTPHSQPPAEGVIFEATDWRVVDINGIMDGNFPIDYELSE
jgi:hypothetical protein